MTILLTDDQGYYPIGTFPAHTGVFTKPPIAVCVTDANGNYNGSFFQIPLTAKQVTNIQGSYTDANGTQVQAPRVCVQTDNRGYSLWSGLFIAPPIAVFLT